MRIRRSSMVGWRAVPLLASLMALGQVAHGQEVRPVRTIQGVAGGGTGAGFQFVQRFDGPGPARGVMIVINGQDIGSSLLKVCDANLDGAATTDEVKAALWDGFRKADTDTNGVLSEIELTTALGSLFPSPQPPAGAPAPPEDHALRNLLAKKLMAGFDANNDAWITPSEAIAFVDQNQLKWDADSSSVLDPSELAAAFAQFMPAPSLSSGAGRTQGGRFITGFDR